MKEKIYTIPVNEAYDTDTECPLCTLEANLETESIDYTLGAAMMEPDFRENSNEKGFCNRHFTKLFARQNKLPLALLLDTHLEAARGKIHALKKHTAPKGGLFKKKNVFSEKLSKSIEEISSGCVVCDKINHTMAQYADVLIYMWDKDSAFRAKFEKSKGVCLKHAKLLADNASRSIGSKADDFLAALLEKEENELFRIQEDIHKFTLKFDYRNKDMDWGSAKDAPVRTIEKLTGYIDKE